jgi:hypothetical protein
MSIARARDLAAGVYNPELPATRDYAHSGSFVSQELPVIQAWRDLAPFLVLPGTCTVHFYCEAPDVPDRVHQLTVTLDPSANRGFTHVTLGFYGQVALRRAGDRGTFTQMTCRACGSPWGTAQDTGYGSAFTCMDCGHDTYHDRGD